MKINPDDFANANAHDVAVVTFSLLNAVQEEAPENIVHASAAFFKLIAARFDLNIQDVMTATGNLITHADGPRPEFRALAQFMENEL